MTHRGALYHRTPAGNAAANCADSQLPLPYRRLLESIGDATFIAFDPSRQDRLDDLEAIGLIESVSMEWLAALFQTESMV